MSNKVNKKELNLFQDWIKSCPFWYKCNIKVDNDKLIYPIKIELTKIKKQ